MKTIRIKMWQIVYCPNNGLHNEKYYGVYDSIENANAAIEKILDAAAIIFGPYNNSPHTNIENYDVEPVDVNISENLLESRVYIA